MGDLDGLLALDAPGVVAGADDGIRVIGLGFAGRRDEAKARLASRCARRIASRCSTRGSSTWTRGSIGRIADMDHRDAAFGGLTIRNDPEAIFQEGWMRCDVGQHEVGLVHLSRAVAKGYFPVATLRERPQFDALRDDARFQALVRQAEAGREQALSAFRDAGGPRLLGV